jgi:hypothetical protein|tara:strand:+ start:379 stop:552 length:174 start_codon:yes stop_codon:yes gene_type:complete
MSEIYHKEVNKRKAKSFFMRVLKNEGRPHLMSAASIELLAEILSDKLLEKLEKEKRT